MLYNEYTEDSSPHYTTYVNPVNNPNSSPQLQTNNNTSHQPSTKSQTRKPIRTKENQSIPTESPQPIHAQLMHSCTPKKAKKKSKQKKRKETKTKTKKLLCLASATPRLNRQAGKEINAGGICIGIFALSYTTTHYTFQRHRPISPLLLYSNWLPCPGSERLCKVDRK